MTIQEVAEAFQSIFNFRLVEETDTKYVFNIISDKKAHLDKAYLQRIINELSTYQSEQQIELYNSNTYEVLARFETRYLGPDDINLKDEVNKIEYQLDSPSDHYLIFFLYNLNKQDTPNILRRRIFPPRLRRLLEPREGQMELFEVSIIDIIKKTLANFQTIQIKSESSKRKTEFDQLLYSFVFNLGYNLDYTLLPLRFMDEFTQPFKMGRIRRASHNEVEPPKRLYLNELILYYQKGVSSNSLDHQFLSFYHVLEHFYEKIYNDDILNSIKNELTKPNFSYKRQRDISGLVAIIQNRLKYKNEEFQINEPEALELTLKKFIQDPSELKSEIESFSPSLINYFKTTEVSFSKGNRINFDEPNETIYKNLARRIYLTRNAIVHSKETEKLKYIPFRDDKDLLNEIYLMRLVSEFVIIESSTEL